METLHKCLVLFLVEPNYSIPAKSGCFKPGYKPGMQQKLPLIAGVRQGVIQKRKTEIIFRFHFLVNLHLLALLIIGVFITVPDAYSRVYYWVCVATGWLFYYTIDKWASAAIIQYRFKGVAAQNPLATGLYALAGYNWKTRLLLLLLLASSIIATFITHLSFALLVGFSLRWLIESQVLEFVAPFHPNRTINPPMK